MTENDANDAGNERYCGRHLATGWWALLVFLTMGLCLEALHGFKVGWYVDSVGETRRLMWTLAHAHGALLGLVNLGFAATVSLRPGFSGGLRTWASRLLLAAVVLLPGGFFLGGVWVYGGDPGLGILLVPAGGLCLAGAVLMAALGVRKAR